MSHLIDHARIPRIIPNLRWWIGGLLFASTVVNYIDRQTLSVLAPHLKTEFHWSNSDFALLIIAFRFAYAVGQTIMGRFLDVANQLISPEAGHLGNTGEVQRRQRLGGLLNYYYRAAA